LLFLPLLFLCPGAPGVLRFLAVYVGLYFLLWSALIQQVRFLFPAMAPAAVVVAFVVTRLGSGSYLVRGLMGSAVAWILVVSAYGQIQSRQLNSSLVPYATGHLDRIGLLRSAVSYYNVVERANRVMDSRARLLFIGSDESLYCERNRLCNSIYDRQELREIAMRAESPAELLKMLGRKRISHMIVHVPRCEEYVRYGIFDWDERAKRNFLDMWHTYGRVVFVSNRVFLFELKPEPLPFRERKTGTPLYFHASENAMRASERVLTARRLFQRQLREEGLEVCHEIVRLVPGAGVAHSLRAYAYGLLKKRQEAITGYETAIRLGYPTTFVYFNLGMLLEDDGKYAAALNRYLKAVELDPGNDKFVKRAARARKLAATAGIGSSSPGLE
jgi:tetratricopeptide (TPR) repeat protein